MTTQHGNVLWATPISTGDGTGGESIWGGEFEDEFHKNLRHDRPFTVSMGETPPSSLRIVRCGVAPEALRRV